MLTSMTGYGKGEARSGALMVTVEIKTVNHRHSDISVKMPRSFLALENDIRKQVGQVLRRGKIDLYVNYEMTEEAQAEPVLNQGLAAAYHRLFDRMRDEFGLSGEIPLALIAGQKDVILVRESELEEADMRTALTQAVAAALDCLLAMRQAEGEETRKDLAARLDAAEQMLGVIEQRAPQIPLEWRGRLQERLDRLQQNLEWDPQRVAQELALFADRCDISEELARFRSHLVQFREMFNDVEPVGRRMDFLLQELNREVNTMGSKSNDAELTRVVVSLKAELEKVREQVQNLE